MAKLELIIDHREHSLFNEMTDRDLDKYKDHINISKENLDLADIHLKYNDIHFVFERKTVPDLLSSIQDGRYKEQKARLLSNVKLSSVTYIIEGDNVIATQSYKQNKSVLLGAYLHMLFRDNIRILFTKNVAETSTLLLTIATKIIDNPDKFTKDLSTCDYTGNLKLKKKKIENIDPKTCYIMQLSQVPHISNVLAKQIASVYPSMDILLNTMKSSDDPIKLLCNIDKIGKEKATILVKYLLT